MGSRSEQAPVVASAVKEGRKSPEHSSESQTQTQEEIQTNEGEQTVKVTRASATSSDEEAVEDESKDQYYEVLDQDWDPKRNYESLLKVLVRWAPGAEAVWVSQDEFLARTSRIPSSEGRRSTRIQNTEEKDVAEAKNPKRKRG